MLLLMLSADDTHWLHQKPGRWIAMPNITLTNTNNGKKMQLLSVGVECR